LLSVNARVSVVALAPPCEFPLTVCLAIGEGPVFIASFVDVNGAKLPERPVVTWSSSQPDVASVNEVGRVTALRPGRVTITASTAEAAGTVDVIVTAVAAGDGPARVRFANADDSHGPLTFVPSRGAPVTLAFGESVDVPVVSGGFSVQIDGFDSAFGSASWMLREGDHLEIFATTGGISSAWSSLASIPADSGLVRFVQGVSGPSNFAVVVLLGAPGATPAESRLVDCYFDPQTVTEYVPVRAGEFDVIASGKGLLFGGQESARSRITVPPGRAVTYAITRDTPDTMRVLAFPDF
jgi:hypothetical protein